MFLTKNSKIIGTADPSDYEEIMFPDGEVISTGEIANVNVNISVFSNGADCSTTTELPSCYVYVKDGSTIKAQIAALYRKKENIAVSTNILSSFDYFTKVMLSPGQTLVILIPGGILSLKEEVHYTTVGYIMNAETGEPVL
jgi:hypothetical protein